MFKQRLSAENRGKNARIAHTKIVRCRVSKISLLFILIYLRKATTQDVFGELFGMAQPVANKWIHLLLPVLNETLANLGELPSRETTPEPVDESAPLPDQETPRAFYFHDGTERPINRPKAPKDQKAYYSGKKKTTYPQE